MKKPHLLVIGNGRHGKDTFCEILRDYHGYKFISSSMFVCQEAIWDEWGSTRYATQDDCYNDRHNHRALWYDMISEFNNPVRTNTATGMLEQGYDIYCGMRKRAEYEACLDAGLFDHVVWVDRSEHLPPEAPESMDLNMGDATLVVDNNGSMRDLWLEIDHLVTKGVMNADA